MINGLVLALMSLCILLLMPYAVSELLTLTMALTRRGAPKERGGAEESVRPHLLFLVPAHDEDAVVQHSLSSLLEMERTATDATIILVADNCSDATAELGRQVGVHVMERHDDSRRGKPFALAWAIEQLPIEDFDAVVIVDADTTVDPGFATALVEEAPLREKVLQPFIGVQNPEDSPITRMAVVYERAIHGLAYRMKARA